MAVIGGASFESRNVTALLRALDELKIAYSKRSVDASGAPGWTAPDVDVVVAASSMDRLTRLLHSFAGARGGLPFQVADIEPCLRRYVLALPGRSNDAELVSIDVAADQPVGLTAKLVALTRCAVRRVTHRAGFQVAFLGLDGVGKTAQRHRAFG